MTTSSRLTTFRELVDNAPDSTFDAIELLYRHYTGFSLASVSIVAEMYFEVIRCALHTTSGLTWGDLRSLQGDLIVESVFNERSLEPYFSILSIIRDALRGSGGALSLSETERWSHAIRAAKAYRGQSPATEFPDSAQIKRLYRREHNTAEAAKRLSLVGFRIEYGDGHFSISASEARRIGEAVDSLRSRVSGKVFGNMLFQLLSARFDESVGRYLIGHKMSVSPRDRYPSIPVGYIFQLAAKSIGQEATDSVDDQRAAFKVLVALATDLSTVYNVEPYLSLEMLAQTEDTIVSFLREIVLYDHIFSIRQLKGSHTLKIIRVLFDWTTEAEIEKRLGFRLDDYVAVVERILVVARHIRGPVRLDHESLQSVLNDMTQIQLDKVLSVISRARGSVNAQYLLPSDADKADYLFRPLVRTTESEFELLDGVCTGWSFYEALANELRRHGIPDVNERLSRAMELLVRKELSDRNIPVVSGWYRNGKVLLECDAVVETPDVIVLFELKIKTLKRVSTAGDSIEMLIDLSKSLIYAQLQAGRHEVFLRQNGSILFTDGQTIELKGREVERIVVTLLDFGGLQDRRILSEFLSRIVGSSVEATSSLENEQRKSFDELNKYCRELLEQFATLEKLQAVQFEGAFFHCWFLSLPQLLTLLDGVSSAQELKDNLWLTRRTVTGTLDFYHDYSVAKAIRARQTS